MSKASESYNLFALRPDLAKEWHPTKNGVLGPKEVTPGSRKKVWWLCEQGHWWSASVSDRVRGRQCSYCRALKKENEPCMVEVKPELLREWHPTKNSEIKAREVLCSHGEKVWWLCERGHEWSGTVRRRLSGKGCPICSSAVPEDFTAMRREVGPAGAPASRPPKQPALQPIGELYEQGAIHHPGKELRRSKRYQHVSTVMIESMPAGIVGYAQLRNYSAGGMLIRSEFALSPGTLLRVRLEAPLYASVSDVVDSRVVWCRRLKEDADHYSQFGIGVDLI